MDDRRPGGPGGAGRDSGETAVTPRIFAAWSDEPWVNEGAAVRVSLICFGRSDAPAMLDGRPVAAIHADLTAGGAPGTVDVTSARALRENAGTAFMGITKVGPFDVSGETARLWLSSPNPHLISNARVLRPSWNGIDVTRRVRDQWIIDFGCDMTETDAALFEWPFSHVYDHVRPMRQSNNRESYRIFWWRHGEARPGLRKLLLPLHRYIVTPEVAKHRLFAWAPSQVLPDKNLQVIARADDATFGLLHSRFHELWSLRMGTNIGQGNTPRYTPTTTFETFPFPASLTPADTAGPVEILDSGVILPGVAAGSRGYALAIAAAAHRLNELRDRWLNPPEWVERVPEVVPGYPDRLLPKPGHEADLKRRTLTNLYNARPAWLDQAHLVLDNAAAAAYGWADYAPDMPDGELLRRLLALNLARAGR